MPTNDFIFKTATGERNLRLESRAANGRTGVHSFHIGGATAGVKDPDNPTLSVGDNYSAFNKPLKIGNYSSPTALLHLAPGTASANSAPLKFTSGTLLTTTESGAIEYDGTVFYSSPTASSRGVSPSEFFIALSSDYTATNGAAAQKVFNDPTNGTITLSGSTTYMFEGQYSIDIDGGANISLGTLFAGTANVSSIGYTAITTKAGSQTVQGDRTSFVNTAGYTTVTQVNTNRYITVIVRGIVRISTGGTFIPQFQFSGAPSAAPVVAANSYFKIYPIGTNIVKSVGNWN